MSVSVVQGRRGVVLALPPAAAEPEAPRLDSVALSVVRASGAFEAGRIELEAAGIPPFFDGDTWRAEWNPANGGFELRLGVPNHLFAPSFDPVARFGLEALARRAAGRSRMLATLDVEVIPLGHDGEREFPGWLPEAFLASARQLRF